MSTSYEQFKNDLINGGFVVKETSKQAQIVKVTKGKRTAIIKYYKQAVSGTSYSKITHWAARLGIENPNNDCYLFIDDPNGKIPPADLKISRDVAAKYQTTITFDTSVI